ncbi:LpxI family protein [Fimbriiglobus ruber]|uniref:UDP-2,3-diacylglucosamine pyrophosphatase n=1 Tax=Fimbriiglobus ruber TaxID=1908690 RepID=A0A225E0Y4_9BACT|nr:UDP-2,3-diacylglucosamine diphosphatase LpxI [Fimbriiglobus ruber]OWK47242.1 Protein of unknown function DUF1009 [Fimbriiglobus ruber]
MGFGLPSVAAEPGATRTTPVGLLAGAGRFPIVFAEKARDLGIPVVCVAIEGMADPYLASVCPKFHRLRRMSLGFIFRSFRAGGVRRWTMAGKFYKHLTLRPWHWWRLMPDWRMARFWYLRRKADRRDDPLLLGLIEEFRGEGFECASALELCPELLVREGVLTRRKPTPSEEFDVKFGWALAKKMGEVDVGQSVMVRNRVVLAVEAIEGTDQAILRAGDLCGRGAFVVVKVAKPQQDMRFDVPTVGATTIETMSRAGAKVLAIEAGKTIILDESQTIELADRHGISITAFPQGAMG